MINDYLLLIVKFVEPTTGYSVCCTEQGLCYIILTFILSNFTMVEVAENSRPALRPSIILCIPVSSILELKGISKVISNINKLC